MPEIKQSNRRWLRFSLATLLFVSLCIGALLAGYQSGYRRGYNSGQALREDETQVVHTYDTTFLVWPDLPDSEKSAAVDQVVDLIKTTIRTDIWDDGSGNEVREWLSNHSILVCAPGAVQKQVRDLLNQLENLHNRPGGMAEEILPGMQRLASIGKTKDWDVDIKAPKSSQAARDWLDKYYAETVEGVAKHWGTPQFQGDCRDNGFPNWSLDETIAIWPRGRGVCYLALRYKEDGQPHIIVGWRESS